MRKLFLKLLKKIGLVPLSEHVHKSEFNSVIDLLGNPNVIVVKGYSLLSGVLFVNKTVVVIGDFSKIEMCRFDKDSTLRSIGDRKLHVKDCIFDGEKKEDSNE